MAVDPHIYQEPASVDPDTLANLGPLRGLAGVWEGTKGGDTNPKLAGPEHRIFTERYTAQPIDPQTNGPQLLYGLRYHTRITASGEQFTFHDQSGYWLWEPATGAILMTLAIPRGQVALAQGHATADAGSFTITATRGRTDFGICSNAFLESAFRTDSLTMIVTFHPDGSWSYAEDTVLKIAGQAEPFLHHDTNHLFRVAEPDPNPAMRNVGGSGNGTR